MPGIHAILLQNSIDLIGRARRQLVALYLPVPPDDPGYEVAVAETIVPVQYRELGESLHAAYDHLLNLRDELAD